MKWWGWILSLLPAGSGILISILAANQIIKDPVLFMRGSLDALAVRGGVILSIITIAVVLTWNHKTRKHKKAVIELQNQASDEHRRFLQRLDHELKNPLTAIRAGLNNITYRPLDDYVTGEVSAVQTQALRINRLVSDLRKLASLETTPLERTKVNLAELLTDAVNGLQERADSDSRHLSLVLPNAPWPLPDVQGDPDLLLLAVHNLLDNAVKFTSPGDTIEVRAFDDGRDVVIEVADTGPGIPENEIQRVWEELYRGEKAHGVPGSGLGLSLVRAIIEKHGGKAALRSRLNQGTVFSIRLPAG